jgi:hypothetical protein
LLATWCTVAALGGLHDGLKQGSLVSTTAKQFE